MLQFDVCCCKTILIKISTMAVTCGLANYRQWIAFCSRVFSITAREIQNENLDLSLLWLRQTKLERCSTTHANSVVDTWTVYFQYQIGFIAKLFGKLSKTLTSVANVYSSFIQLQQQSLVHLRRALSAKNQSIPDVKLFPVRVREFATPQVMT